MRFSELFLQSNVQPQHRIGDGDISALSCDSRSLAAGEVFVCVPSLNHDPHDFIQGAVAAGASALVVHSQEAFDRYRTALPIALLPQEAFDDALWRLAKTAFRNPSHDLRIVGVTGTNGKTTVAWIMRAMLEQLGVPSAYIGTLGFARPGSFRELPNTTPVAIEVNRMLAECRDSGVEAVSMEVSSHALAQKRVEGIEFDAAVFTNLTQDHLDFHGTMEQYGQAKRRLFAELPQASDKKFRAALNIADPVGLQWASDLGLSTFCIARQPGDSRQADLVGSPLHIGLETIEMELSASGKDSAAATANLGGAFNCENLLSASAGLVALSQATDLWPDDRDLLRRVVSAFKGIHPVPGRFEPVPNDSGIGILVDYAHTPDALDKLLGSVRQQVGTEVRIITVFGCGGDRDATKRPLMAAIAARWSDLIVATSDNPRTEDPQQILSQVVAGFPQDATFLTIPDREQAILQAVRSANSGDVVVIAGKGHENYQIIGTAKSPMDDRDLARKALAVPR